MKRFKFPSRSIFKKRRARKIIGFSIGGVGIAALALQANAQTTIISDDFGDSNGSSFDRPTWPGRTPDLVNLPGGVWNQVNGFSWGQAYTTHSNSAYNGFSVGIGNTAENGTGMAISISSTNSYVEPTQLLISAGLAIEMNGNNPAANSMQLGFYNAATSFSFYNNQSGHFTGLSIDTAGDLSLIVDGGQIGNSVAFGGTFDPNALTTLSFQVNTATGTVSNISFGTSTADYSSLESGTGLFSASNMAYAGNYAQGSQNDNGSATSDFLVEGITAVPEPSVCALLGGGMLALGAFQYRRRRKASGYCSGSGS